GILLDEADGVNRSQKPIMPAGFQPPKIVVSSWNRKGSSSGSRSETFRLLHAKNVARPQLKFKEKVDNSNTPFVPKIFIKPNALKPLPSCMPSLLSSWMYKPMAETKLSFIDSLEDLVALNEKLSFLGLTCLMQISTREEDFIIDTLELRSEMYILNEAFTDPSIVKASRALNLARHSLDHLLKQFCNVNSDKRYQLADWRIRCKYVKPIYTEESYLELQRKQKRSFNTQQLTTFRLLYAWRDKLARQEDESTG
ncbi:hypothetical protein XENOCAPTIV_004916, partial [Xenoophorus captivus]